MDELMKKGLELGLGITAITVGALTEAMNKLEKEGKISRKEGERMVRDVVDKYHAKNKKYMDDMQKQLEGLMKSMPFATKKDIENINARIERMFKQSKKRR
jgi:polyhydroxyalkanoate synthesis regulator phasin